MINKSVGFIGVGQAGGNVVSEFEKLGYSSFYINTSMEDLSTLQAAHTYHLKGGEGCYKNRDRAKELLASNIDDVIAEIKMKIEEPIVFVAFAAGGGTGSGISPLLMEILQQETEKKVCSIVILPSESESIKSHINAYECCKELSSIENIGASFFLDNNRMVDKFTINKVFSGLLNSLLSNNTVSNKGCIDNAEIKEIITTKGMAIISKLGKDKAQTSNMINTFSNNIFATMENDRVIKYIGLINSTMDISTDDLMKSVGVPLDTFIGYDAPVSVCILAGLSLPFTRLSEIKDKVKANQETITKSLRAVNENKLLNDDINFLEGISVIKKPVTESKKSSRDALMKFMCKSK